MRRIHLVLVPALLLALVTALAPTADAGSKSAALVLKLKHTRLSKVTFKDTKLTDVVKWLRVATGMNFHVKRPALLKAGIDIDEVTVTATLSKVKLLTFLDIALDAHELGVKVKGNVVYITTKKDTYGKPVALIYGISHITWTKVDFIAPEIDLRPSGSTFGEEYEPERIVEDDPLTSGDAVIDLIREITGASLWEDNDDWSMTGTDKYIVVKAPKSMQARVSKAISIVASMK